MFAPGLLLFAVTELLLSFSPGPAVFLVVSEGMRGGFRTAVRAAAGILTGNAIYFAASAAGLGALLLASHRVFAVIEWLGAAYLAAIGLKMMLLPAEPVIVGDELESHPGFRPYRKGVFTQLANPKAIIFFTALLPQFIDPRAAMAPQFLILGVVSIGVELPVFLFYGFAADRGRSRLGRHAKTVERLAGACLVAAAVRLAMQHF
jgi:homoserine/homoserine lactone efflux protein